MPLVVSYSVNAGWGVLIFFPPEDYSFIQPKYGDLKTTAKIPVELRISRNTTRAIYITVLAHFIRSGGSTIAK